MTKKTEFDSRNATYVFEQLEVRQLLSGGIEGIIAAEIGSFNSDYISADLDDFTQTDINEGYAASVQTQTQELVFVDKAVSEYQVLLDGILSNNERNIEVVLLDSNRNGLEQISEVLSDYHNLDAVHIISHGADGTINLGNTSLNQDTLNDNQFSMLSWANSFNDNGDILIYGCNLAQSDIGKNLINSISELTLTDVAASDDLTGHDSLGGDWTLEFSTGLVESKVAYGADVQNAYTSTFAAPSDLDVVSSSQGGLSINEDGGNDAYLIANDGGAIFGGLTEFTSEVRFSADNLPSSTYSDLISYATASQDEEVWLSIERTSGTTSHIELAINGVIVSATGYNANALFDGQQHTISTTWNSVGGVYEIFVDGESILSGTGLKSGHSLLGGGELTLVRDQDSPGGGFDLTERFSGVLHDVRFFNEIRTNSQIEGNYLDTLPYDESGLIANWTFKDFSLNASTGNRIVN